MQDPCTMWSAGFFLRGLWPWLVLRDKKEESSESFTYSKHNLRDILELSGWERKTWQKQPKDSGLTLCLLKIFQFLEGFQSEFGEFINRKTNLAGSVFTLPFSRLQHKSPNLESIKAEETFCEFRDSPPVCRNHIYPHFGKTQAPALKVLLETVLTLFDSLGADWGNESWKT